MTRELGILLDAAVELGKPVEVHADLKSIVIRVAINGGGETVLRADFDGENDVS